ncbi:MAG: DUF4363 family protein [Clostridia bacterium]|nr:DUF4363 family protein [Clostridia bacterium]
MKRIAVAVPLLLAFITGASLSCLFFLRDTESEAGAFIAEVETAAMSEDYDACRRTLDEFGVFWDERERYYLLFVRHEEMHDIKIGIEQMKGFAQCRDKSGIIGELRMLKAMLSHITESETPLLKNIL